MVVGLWGIGLWGIGLWGIGLWGIGLWGLVCGAWSVVRGGGSVGLDLWDSSEVELEALGGGVNPHRRAPVESCGSEKKNS